MVNAKGAEPPRVLARTVVQPGHEGRVHPARRVTAVDAGRRVRPDVVDDGREAGRVEQPLLHQVAVLLEEGGIPRAEKGSVALSFQK